MVDFASTTAMLSLGDALSENPVNDAANPNTAWYTLGIKNDGVGPIARVLVADDPPKIGRAHV